MESPPMFDSAEEECKYWRDRAHIYYKDWSDCKEEYEEYVAQSQQVEAELDSTIEENQALMLKLQRQTINLENQNDSLKWKVEKTETDFSNMVKKLHLLQNSFEEKKKYVRELEQKNDDLENSHRVVTESLKDVQQKLDEAYEKNALLEMEIVEGEVLREKYQRLKDEAKELKQELIMQSRRAFENDNTVGRMVIRNEGLPLNADFLMTWDKITSPKSSMKALKIVADMLNKLEHLQKKLRNYREQRTTKVLPKAEDSN